MKLKKIKGLLFIFSICICCIIPLSGCGNTLPDEGTASDSEKMINIKLYYLNADYTNFAYDEADIDQLSSTESIIDMVMNMLITEPEDADLHIPVPDGMSYQRYNYNGEGNVTIIFNVDYETCDTYEMLISKAAFTNTLCQIDTVTSVTFDLVDLLNDRVETMETYSVSSFAYLDDYDIDYTFEAGIFYPDEDGVALVPVYVELDSSSNVSLMQQIMELLCVSGDGYQAAIEDISYVSMVTLNNGICYVDMTSDFGDYQTGISEKLVIYSIVNSLCTLSNVETVCISIDGYRSLTYGDISLNVDLEPDYSYLKQEEN